MGSKLKRMCFATKDLGGFRVASPVAMAFKEMGYEIVVFAEGLSVAKWAEIGFATETLEAELSQLLQFLQMRPAAVIVTCGAPINMEDAVACAARRIGIPLVVIGDIWGVARRVTATPQMVFVTDAFDEELHRREARFRDATFVHMGSPLGDIRVTEHERCVFNALRQDRDRVILLAGQGKSTSDLLHVTLTSLALSPNAKHHLVPLWHPTQVGLGINERVWNTQIRMWSEYCSAHHMQASWSPCPPDIRTDALAALADITVGGHSSLLLQAASHGHDVVSISTPHAREDLVKCGVGYNKFPGIAAGIALELNEPVEDLLGWIASRREDMRTAQRTYFSRHRMSGYEMADTIARFV